MFGTATRADAADDSAASQTASLGSIELPNSGATATQAAFLTGMMASHSFEYEHAGEAFAQGSVFLEQQQVAWADPRP